MNEQTIPGGTDKGKKVSEVSDNSLAYWATNAKSAALKNACIAEQKRRGGGGSAPATQAIQKTQTAAAVRAQPDMSLGKALSDAGAVTKFLADCANKFHLVAPVTTIDSIPEGFGVSVSYVQIDPSTDKGGAKDVYEVGGRMGLSGTALNRIAAAAGLDWDPRQCGRVDDGSDPRYVHYRAVGYVRQFDGTSRTVTGEVEIDMREGSPQLDEIREKSAQTAKKYDKADDGGVSQIREIRKFILRHAESKAKNRAIACMGVRRSYGPTELAKPFAVARLVFTGRSSDPQLRREFARMGAERALDGQHRLYGNAMAQPAALPEFRGHAPPQVGSRGFDNGGYDYDTEGDEVPTTPQPEPAKQEAAQPAQTQPEPQPATQEPAVKAASAAAAAAATQENDPTDRGDDPNAY